MLQGSEQPSELSDASASMSGCLFVSKKPALGERQHDEEQQESRRGGGRAARGVPNLARSYGQVSGSGLRTACWQCPHNKFVHPPFGHLRNR